MSAVHGTYTNGKVVLDAPADWPEGTEVVVRPLSLPEVVMMDEDDQQDDPDNVTRWIAAFDAVPPLLMSAEDEAAMLEWQRKVGEHTAAAVRRQMSGEGP